MVIKANPADVELIREHRDDWVRSLEGMEKLLIREDPQISRGGCIVETQIGDVDAQVEERLGKLKSALIDAIRKGNDSE